jgi:hypothetical protein
MAHISGFYLLEQDAWAVACCIMGPRVQGAAPSRCRGTACAVCCDAVCAVFLAACTASNVRLNSHSELAKSRPRWLSVAGFGGPTGMALRLASLRLGWGWVMTSWAVVEAVVGCWLCRPNRHGPAAACLRLAWGRVATPTETCMEVADSSSV